MKTVLTLKELKRTLISDADNVRLRREGADHDTVLKLTGRIDYINEAIRNINSLMELDEVEIIINK